MLLCVAGALADTKKGVKERKRKKETERKKRGEEVGEVFTAGPKALIQFCPLIIPEREREGERERERTKSLFCPHGRQRQTRHPSHIQQHLLSYNYYCTTTAMA